MISESGKTSHNPLISLTKDQGFNESVEGYTLLWGWYRKPGFFLLWCTWTSTVFSTTAHVSLMSTSPKHLTLSMSWVNEGDVGYAWIKSAAMLQEIVVPYTF